MFIIKSKILAENSILPTWLVPGPWHQFASAFAGYCHGLGEVLPKDIQGLAHHKYFERGLRDNIGM